MHQTACFINLCYSSPQCYSVLLSFITQCYSSPSTANPSLNYSNNFCGDEEGCSSLRTVDGEAGELGQPSMSVSSECRPWGVLGL